MCTSCLLILYLSSFASPFSSATIISPSTSEWSLYSDSRAEGDAEWWKFWSPFSTIQYFFQNLQLLCLSHLIVNLVDMKPVPFFLFTYAKLCTLLKHIPRSSPHNQGLNKMFLIFNFLFLGSENEPGVSNMINFGEMCSRSSCFRKHHFFPGETEHRACSTCLVRVRIIMWTDTRKLRNAVWSLVKWWDPGSRREASPYLVSPKLKNLRNSQTGNTGTNNCFLKVELCI